MDIYADEGLSGTSLKHRDNFLRMIKDCEAGLIDLIVTKSVSRFARNLMDSVGYIRKLGALNPPIEVYFETENLNTLNSQSEMSIAFLSTMAQEESHNKSEIMNLSIEMRFRRGIFLTPALLGYDIDADGKLVINEEEANTVRLIFFMYIFGYSCQQIAATLTKLQRRTKKGNIKWSAGTVLSQLQNERHCGSVLARKTFTPEDYCTASTSIENGSGSGKLNQITVEKGDLDLRGFEIVRAQFSVDLISLSCHFRRIRSVSRWPVSVSLTVNMWRSLFIRLRSPLSYGRRMQITALHSSGQRRKVEALSIKE